MQPGVPAGDRGTGMTSLSGPGPGPVADPGRTGVEEELRALSAEYGAAADGRDGARFAALFVPEGELVVPRFPDPRRPGVTRSGHDELIQVPGALSRYERTFHRTSDHRYTVGDGVASGEVLCVAHHASAGRPDGHGGPATPTDTVWFIRYLDAYRLTGAGWRFARRELHLQWVEVHPIVPGSLPGSPTGS